MAEIPAQPPVLAPRLLPAAPSSFFLWERLPVVLDTNVLLADCAHVVRSGKTSFLLASGELPIARLFATEHVRREVEKYLPGHAEEAGIDAAEAMRVWRESYQRVIRFVDLDGEARDERVRTLAARDVDDRPTGLLAELLAPCLVFSRDRDLLDTGIARREWVTLSSAGHDVAQLQALYSSGMFGTLLIGVTGWEVGSAVVAAAKSFPLPTLLIGGFAGWCLWRFWWDTERGAQHRAEARSLVKDAARGIGAAWDRADEAEVCSRRRRSSRTMSRRLSHGLRASSPLRQSHLGPPRWARGLASRRRRQLRYCERQSSHVPRRRATSWVGATSRSRRAER